MKIFEATHDNKKMWAGEKINTQVELDDCFQNLRKTLMKAGAIPNEYPSLTLSEWSVFMEPFLSEFGE